MFRRLSSISRELDAALDEVRIKRLIRKAQSELYMNQLCSDDYCYSMIHKSDVLTLLHPYLTPGEFKYCKKNVKSIPFLIGEPPKQDGVVFGDMF